MGKFITRAVFRRYILLLVVALLLIIGLLVYGYMKINSYDSFTHTPDGLRDADVSVAVVPGSAVDDIAKLPRAVVRERLDATITLYEQSVVSAIIVSGFEDTERNDYDEADVMRRYLVDNGIPEESITEDKRGDNSYLTCRNLQDINRDENVVLVTQSTHLPRMLFLCRSMGISAYGYEADLVQSSRWFVLQTVREAFSNVKALFDIHIRYTVIES